MSTRRHLLTLSALVALIGYAPGLYLLDPGTIPTHGGVMGTIASVLNLLFNIPLLIGLESFAFWHELVPYVLPAVLGVATLGALFILYAPLIRTDPVA